MVNCAGVHAGRRATLFSLPPTVPEGYVLEHVEGRPGFARKRPLLP